MTGRQLTSIFCFVDDFCKNILPELGKKLRVRKDCLLESDGLHLITKVRQNMKPKPISTTNEVLLKKRGIVEITFGQLKDFRHLVHTKYRSKINYFTNVLSALLAYMLNPGKPKICLNRIEMN